MINQTLSTRIFPEKLKEAKVVPLFKNGTNKVISNYRPISLLPAMLKVFEKIIYNQLYQNFYSKFFLQKSVWFSEKSFNRTGSFRAN